MVLIETSNNEIRCNKTYICSNNVLYYFFPRSFKALQTFEEHSSWAASHGRRTRGTHYENRYWNLYIVVHRRVFYNQKLNKKIVASVGRAICRKIIDLHKILQFRLQRKQIVQACLLSKL